MIAVRLGVEPRLDRRQLLTKLRQGFCREEYRVGHLDVRVSAVRKDEVAVPTGDGQKRLLILRSGEHVLALDAKPHIKGVHAVVGKAVHAKTTPFRLAN